MGLREKKERETTMKERNAKKKGKRKVKTYSEELVEFCEEFDVSTELIVANDAISNWDGDWRLENLPADTPKALRKRLAEVTRGIEKVRPALDALVDEIAKIIR